MPENVWIDAFKNNKLNDLIFLILKQKYVIPIEPLAKYKDD